MNFDVEKRTIYLVRHGSQAYGTATATSDTDVKGICIPPSQCYHGFLEKFEQYEKMHTHVGGDLARLDHLKGQECDLVIYSLAKFANLAAQCNPNIIEVLHVADEDILMMDEFGEQLRDVKDAFLSKKARHTFSGYAHAQLARIKTHRAWLLNPPKQPPSRADFGLSEQTKVSQSELGAFDALLEKGAESGLSEAVIQLYQRERSYQNMVRQWKQYLTWKTQRNPARAANEAKHGYDTKHGMHLLRLMRMCKEIMTTGKVLVKRPDAEELLRVRNGSLSYDALIEEAETLDAECDTLYKTSTVLPHKPDMKKLDDLIVSMTMRYLVKFG